MQGQPKVSDSKALTSSLLILLHSATTDTRLTRKRFWNESELHTRMTPQSVSPLGLEQGLKALSWWDEFSTHV